MTDRLVRLSKTVSHALRHEPASYGLVPDENEWVEVDTLLAALAESGWPGLVEADLHEMIARSPKKRHEIVAGSIRARHGHSIAVQLDVPPSRPPDRPRRSRGRGARGGSGVPHVGNSVWLAAAVPPSYLDVPE